MKTRIFLLSSIFILLILISSLFFSFNYFFEVLVSITPYFFFILLSTLVGTLILLIKNHKLTILSGFNLASATVFLNILFILLSGSRIASFSYLKPSSASSNGRELKVAFFNTLYTNNNFDEINKQIRSVDADILGLSEMTPDRIASIDALKDYPYSVVDLNYRSKDTSIYSKFPIERITEIDQDTDFFNTGKVDIDGKNYNIIVAHPVPPINTYWYEIRKTVFGKLSDRINKIDKSDTILMGDFNLTPWSPVYSVFTRSMPELKNTAYGHGLNTTWGEGLIKLHIDHIFVPNNTEIKEYKILGNAGSDHKMIFAKIRLDQ
jgi:endonuclease/exonuclease/phosphatase (EEP) superfamily protein YafD